MLNPDNHPITKYVYELEQRVRQLQNEERRLTVVASVTIFVVVVATGLVAGWIMQGLHS